MENEFTKVMSERKDEELIKIVTIDREKYNKDALDASDFEIQKRNIDTTVFEEIKQTASIQKEQKQKVDSNVVGSGIRFINFITDFIVWLIIVFLMSFTIGLFVAVTPVNEGILTSLFYILLLCSFIAYYAIMEIKFQKTVGKFVTKTKVVKMNGDKPENGVIMTRTFCRLIPFDRISFLFVRNGIHDFLSNTKVVKDTTE